MNKFMVIDNTTGMQELPDGTRVPVANRGGYDGTTVTGMEKSYPELNARWEFTAGAGCGIHNLVVEAYTEVEDEEDAEGRGNMGFTQETTVCNWPIRVSGKTGEVWVRCGDIDILCQSMEDAKTRVEGEAEKMFGPDCTAMRPRTA